MDTRNIKNINIIEDLPRHHHAHQARDKNIISIILDGPHLWSILYCPYSMDHTTIYKESLGVGLLYDTYNMSHYYYMWHIYFISRKGEFKHMPKEQRKAAKKAKKLAKKGYKW